MSLSASMTETADRMREQGAMLIEVGQRLMKMGHEQLAAAESVDANRRLIYPDERMLEAPIEVDTKREYIKTVDVAYHLLVHFGPMERGVLFAHLSNHGARCSSEQSLNAMLNQTPQKFMRMHDGRWCARGDTTRGGGLSRNG